MTWELG
jgi:diacylglycerol kinase family enzyme